jgi:chromosome partitioning protein
MRLRRRDRGSKQSDPTTEAEAAPEERFFDEVDTEPEHQETESLPVALEPSALVEPVGDVVDAPADQAGDDPAQPSPSEETEPESEPSIQAAAPEAEEPEAAPEAELEDISPTPPSEPSTTAVDPVAHVDEPQSKPERVPPRVDLDIPPLPKDPGLLTPDPIAIGDLPSQNPDLVEAAEPAPAAPAEAQVETSAPVEPAHVPAHARSEASANFAERAQMAMNRLGELPASNGTPKATRPLPRVVAIANQKGGVGKTTTTVNLGAALSELDYRVLVVDLDPQGNATSGLGIDTRNFESSMYDVIMRDAPIEDCIEPTSVQNLFVTPATIDLAGVEIELVSAFSRELKLKRAIETVVDDFDFVLIDCPPSLGLLTINGLAAASEVLVPIQCEYYALEGLSQLIRNVQLVASNLNVGLEISAIVLTMFDARTRLAIDVADEVRSHFKDVVCRSIIPRTVRLSEAPSFGQPITVFDPSSRGAVAYRELAKEVSDGAPKRSG